MSIIKAKFDESACIINRLRLKWNGEVQQMNLAKRMAYLKKRDGLTTEMLSQRSGVATGTLNKLLNGATRRPALETMERVARAFGVPVRYFTDAAVLGTEFEVGAYVEEQGMFAISARERDMLEVLRGRALHGEIGVFALGEASYVLRLYQARGLCRLDTINRSVSNVTVRAGDVLRCIGVVTGVLQADTGIELP